MKAKNIRWEEIASLLKQDSAFLYLNIVIALCEFSSLLLLAGFCTQVPITHLSLPRLVIPLAGVVVGISFPLFLWSTLLNTGISAWRKRNARCVHCGYDLTESGDRCPECGTNCEPSTD